MRKEKDLREVENCLKDEFKISNGLILDNDLNRMDVMVVTFINYDGDECVLIFFKHTLSVCKVKPDEECENHNDYRMEGRKDMPDNAIIISGFVHNCQCAAIYKNLVIQHDDPDWLERRIIESINYNETYIENILEV